MEIPGLNRPFRVAEDERLGFMVYFVDPVESKISRTRVLLEMRSLEQLCAWLNDLWEERCQSSG